MRTRAAVCAHLGRGNRLWRWRVSSSDAQDGGCSLDQEGKPCVFRRHRRQYNRAQRLRAVASTPISEELVDRVRRAN